MPPKSQSRQTEHQQREQRNASPVGDALAVIPYVNAQGEKDSRMLELAPVWVSERGNYTFKLDMMPLAWLDPHHPRTIVIKMRGEKK